MVNLQKPWFFPGFLRSAGVIDQLDYIEGMGFDCIWITPVVKSLDYTGYFAEAWDVGGAWTGPKNPGKMARKCPKNLWEIS